MVDFKQGIQYLLLPITALFADTRHGMNEKRVKALVKQLRETQGQSDLLSDIIDFCMARLNSPLAYLVYGAALALLLLTVFPVFSTIAVFATALLVMIPSMLVTQSTPRDVSSFIDDLTFLPKVVQDMLKYGLNSLCKDIDEPISFQGNPITIIVTPVVVAVLVALSPVFLTGYGLYGYGSNVINIKNRIDEQSKPSNEQSKPSNEPSYPSTLISGYMKVLGNVFQQAKSPHKGTSVKTPGPVSKNINVTGFVERNGNDLIDEVVKVYGEYDPTHITQQKNGVKLTKAEQQVSDALDKIRTYVKDHPEYKDGGLNNDEVYKKITGGNMDQNVYSLAAELYKQGKS